MTIRDVQALHAHWKKTPPVHVALARIDDILCRLAGVRRLEPEAAQHREASPMTQDELIAYADRLNAAVRVAHG